MDQVDLIRLCLARGKKKEAEKDHVKPIACRVRTPGGEISSLGA
jgi:hypothetical protein